MSDYGYISDNLKALCGHIEELSRSVGREVTLVCVTKSGTDDELLALASLGITDVGENRPQQLKRRGELLREHGYRPRLHEIGNLQKNKVRQIIDGVALIHSVDSVGLAEEIGRQARRVGRVVPVLLEVNSAEEENKGGVSPKDAEALYLAVKDIEGVCVSGLMTMGPVTECAEDIRPYFRRTKALFDELNGKYGFPNGGILSMGMSDSYAVAIEEGATLVRVGSRLFEKRKEV